MNALTLTGAVLLAGLVSAAAWADEADSRDAAQTRRIARGDELCQLLAPSDFASVGVKGAGRPVSNSTPPTDFYCVYAGVSSYKGGIEFDVFLSDSTAEAADVFKTVTQETVSPKALDRAKDLGVDQAKLELEAKGDSDPVATISVRSGKLVFSIGFPSNPEAEAQLLSLARTVLQRGAALTK